MGDFWRVVREFNPEGIEREATAPVDLAIVGLPGSGRRTIARALFGSPADSESLGPFEIVDLDFAGNRWPQLEGSDLVVLVVRLDADLAEVSRKAAAAFGRARTPVVLVFTHADVVHNNRETRNAAYRAFSFVSHLKTLFLNGTDSVEVQEKLAPLLVETLPDHRTALARRVPALRQLVAEQIISETCRVNAQFALAANLPANLPFLGSVAGSVADFFVLTKNQVMMVFRLAAIYGRDIAPTLQVAAEIAPVIGGGLLWRSAARLAVGLLPTFVAAAPKMGIAYVGTYAAGQAARYYYDQGQQPTRELIDAFSAEGSRLFRLIRGVDSRQ